MYYEDMFSLIVLYIVLLLILLGHIFIKLKSEKRLTFISLVRIMYVLIFCVVPILVHSHVGTVGQDSKNLLALDYSTSGLIQFYCMPLFVVLGYIGLNAGYRTKFVVSGKRATYSKTSETKISGGGIDYSDKVIAVSAFALFVAGLVSLLLWTRAFGGIVNILQYAAQLRSGNEDLGITNSYAILKRFAPLLQFSNIMFFALWAKNRRFGDFAMSIVTLIFSIFYLLANDGRAPMAMHFVALIWTWSACRNKKTKVKRVNYFIIAVIAVVALFVMHNYEVLYASIFKGHELVLSFDIFSSVRDEFAWTVRNIQAVFLALKEDPLMFRLPTEIISGICGILPSGFRPDWVEMLEKVNTSYWTTGAPVQFGGGKPPDIISTGIYTMNLLGVFFLPFIYGVVLRKMDMYFERSNGTYKNALFACLIYPTVRTVAYTNFDGLTRNLFYILVGCAVMWIVNKMLPTESKQSVRTSSENKGEAYAE